MSPLFDVTPGKRPRQGRQGHWKCGGDAQSMDHGFGVGTRANCTVRGGSFGEDLGFSLGCGTQT